MSQPRGHLALALLPVILVMAQTVLAQGIPLHPRQLAFEELDFEPVLRDLLLLSWPIAPCCSETCRGLCPTCGTNLNDRACQCGPKEGNKPFAGLGDLLRQSGDDNP